MNFQPSRGSIDPATDQPGDSSKAGQMNDSLTPKAVVAALHNHLDTAWRELQTHIEQQKTSATGIETSAKKDAFAS